MYVKTSERIIRGFRFFLDPDNPDIFTMEGMARDQGKQISLSDKHVKRK
jgi:hypothetical protein